MPVRNEADPRWDSLKSTIETKYSKSSLEGKKGVMETMARDYKFSKSKSQYESQFKIWGIRKYRKKDDWKSIGRNIAERKQAGKESNVYINGDMILRSKVQKETRRHGFVTALEQNRPAPIPPIPDGFEIRTPSPTPAAEEIVPLLTLPGDTPSSPIGMQTPSFASSQLQIVSSALPSQTVISDASLDVLRNAMSPSPPSVMTDLSPIQSQNAILNIPYAQDIYGSPISLFDDDDKYLRRLSSFFILPFCQLREDLLAQVESSLISKTTQISGFDLTLGTSLLPECTHDVSHRDVGVLHKMLKAPETLAAVFKALLPSENDQKILRSNYSHSDSASSKIFSLLIFAMANNFAGLNSVPTEEITDFLNRHASTQLLQQILSTSGPESEAFAENLFQAAILFEDARMVKVLLQRGLVPNDLVCIKDGFKYTPVEYASMKRNVEITRLLLNAKSDVHKSLAGEVPGGGPINCAIGWQWERSEHPCETIPFELVHMLLEAGCNFSWQDVKFWASQDNQKVLDLLLDHSFKTKTYEEAWHQFVQHMSECDNATAIRTCRKFLRAGVTIDHRFYSNIHGEICFPIEVAAARGNLELVQLLLRCRESFTRTTLSHAIRSKNKELIWFLIENGAEVVAFHEGTHQQWYHEEDSSSASSPLAEAIRWGDEEILDLLEEKGAWSRIMDKLTTKGEFEDVLEAAIVQGKLPIVQKLLNFRPPNTHGGDLGGALHTAIHAKESAITLALLDAGAGVNGHYCAAVGQDFDCAPDIDLETYDDSIMTSDEGKALLGALLQKNEQLVRSVLDADMDLGDQEGAALVAAVEWGNLSIIEELIGMGFHGAGTALEGSIKKRDIECTRLLINAGAEITSEALRAAVINNDVEMVEYLLSVGADPADPQAFREAEALPHGLPIIERLLIAFARSYPHGRPGFGYEIFQRAIREGNPALTETLLNAKIDVSLGWHARSSEMGRHHRDDNVTLLGDAIMQQHTTSLAILQKLLNEIGNPNIVVRALGVQPCHRETALLVAIHTEDIQKVRLLIDAGANVNWPATKGIKRTPLQKSAEVGSYEITQLLIDQGGLVNNEPAVRGGATALQLAAIGGYIGIGQLLLENDADVNAPAAKFYGRTALEGAAEHGRIDMLKLLWNAGATFQGSEYEKARELAKENGHMATWRYLEHLYPSSEMASMDY